MPLSSKSSTGMGYFFHGLSLAFSPSIRKFVLLPLIANIVLVGGALWYLFSHLELWIDSMIGQLPDFLAWLSYLLWPLLVVTIIGTFSYFFSTLANIIAAPFNGLLAEKVEGYLIGEPINQDGLWAMVKDVPRIMAREWRKLLYIVPKALGLFLILLIPALGQTLGPILWFAFSAWILAVQYCDYPFDNHKVSFNTMRGALKSKQSKAYTFGALVSVFTAIPVLNLFIMPVAICGATSMWVHEFKTSVTR